MVAVERVAGFVLMVGVVLSILLNASGIVLYAIKEGDVEVRFSEEWIVKGGGLPDQFSASLSALIKDLSPFTLISLGVYTLIMTPYLRVAILAAYFAKKRDVYFTLITSIVLLILGFNLLLH